jgi:hypothetical protein
MHPAFQSILTTNICYSQLNKQFTARSVKRVAMEEWRVAISIGVSIEAMPIVSNPFEILFSLIDRIVVYNSQLVS